MLGELGQFSKNLITDPCWLSEKLFVLSLGNREISLFKA